MSTNRNTKSSTSSSSDPPTGIYIDPPSNKWMIGQCLGSGACGSVHILTKKMKNCTNHLPSNYAVKVAPIPPSHSKAKSSKKKKNELEKNADLLYYENTLYRNVFNELRGNMIPDIPVAGYGTSSASKSNGSSTSATVTNSIPPIGFGDLDKEGYRFLIMERMEHPFHFIVPFLLNNNDNKSFLDIGCIATRLIKLIQAVHDTQRLFVDVKPENFMIAKSSSSTSSIKSLADRIRLIDFGLVEPLKDATNNKHRQNSYPDGQVVGTPIYASLHVLNGHTVSRRDDLESVGYVIVELILQIMNFVHGGSGAIRSSSSKKRKTSKSDFEGKDVPNDLLPWSNPNAKSDHEIYTLKKNAMMNDCGELWSLLNEHDGHNSCQLMKEYFDHVMSLEYKTKPDYDLLCDIVSKLRIGTSSNNNDHVANDTTTVTTKRSTRGTRKSSNTTMTQPSRKKLSNVTTKKTASTRSSTREVDEVYVEEGEEEVGEEPSSAAASNKRKTRTSRKAAEDSQVIVESIGYPGGRKARKKRITKTTVTTTETIEFIEADDGEDDEDAFLDSRETIEIDEDEEMPSADDYEEAAGKKENHYYDPSVDTSFQSCNSMDWEAIPNKENEAWVMYDNSNNNNNIVSTSSAGRADRTKKDTKPPAEEYSLKLECIEGSQLGTVLSLTGELLVGQNPYRGGSRRGGTNKKDVDTFEIENDDKTSAIHAKLVLNKSGSKKKPLLTVRVMDMKSHHGTFVNGKKVSGSGKQAFVNDKIRIGQNVFCIKHG